MRPALLLALVAVGGLVACGRGTPPPAGDGHAAPPRPVTTVEVRRTGPGGEVSVPATVQARQRAGLAARIPASVVELPFREGEGVAAGAVLVRLDDVALKSAVAAAEAASAAAEADLARLRALLKTGAATPRELEEGASRAAGAQAALLLARENLSYAVLRAPFAGTLAARPVHVGDVVSPGTTLVEVEGTGGLEVKATIGPDLVGAAQPGLEVRAVVDAQAGPLPATLRSVAPAGDPATHRFEVRADLAAAPGLRSGLFARLLMPSPSAPPRLTAPARALFERGGLTGVFVVSEGRARLRWVAVGETAGGMTEVRAGVEAGERVAVEPAGLEDGVRVDEARAAR